MLLMYNSHLVPLEDAQMEIACEDCNALMASLLQIVRM